MIEIVKVTVHDCAYVWLRARENPHLQNLASISWIISVKLWAPKIIPGIATSKQARQGHIERILHSGTKIWILFSSGDEWVKYCFHHKTTKFIFPSHHVIFLPLDKRSLTIFSRLKAGNDVIDILTGEDMGAGCSFVWVLRMVYFPVKHLCLYNKIMYVTWEEEWICCRVFHNNLSYFYKFN